MRTLEIVAAAWGVTAFLVAAEEPRPVVPATSPAKSPYTDFRDVQWLTIQDENGHKLLTAIIRPPGPGPFPAVVVLHGGDGLNTAYLSLARDVSRAGFVVVVGCWQAANSICSDAPSVGDWVGNPGKICGKELVSLAKRVPNVRPDRIGLYGLSRGGHAALWAASTGAQVKAVVVDAPAHEPSPMSVYPPPAKPLTVIRDLDAPVLMMHGTSDQVIPVSQSREYEQAAREAGKPLIAEYLDGAGHMPSLSRADARQRAIDFLKQELTK